MNTITSGGEQTINTRINSSMNIETFTTICYDMQAQSHTIPTIESIMHAHCYENINYCEIV